MIRVLHDFVDKRDPFVLNEMPLYGTERLMGASTDLPDEGPLVPFRLYDDDDNLVYLGELSNDDECLNQMAILRFGEADAGATTIEVSINGVWTQEIG